MRVYDLASAKLLRTIAASGQPVIADNTLVARSPHDGSYTNTVFGFWNLDSGKMLTAVCVENWYSYAFVNPHILHVSTVTMSCAEQPLASPTGA